MLKGIRCGAWNYIDQIIHDNVDTEVAGESIFLIDFKAF